MTSKDMAIVSAVTPIVYLAGAFMAWDFNPGNWDKFLRLICVVLAAFVSMAVAEYRDRYA